MEDNASVHFVLVTSAPQSGVKLKSITSYFNTIIGDNNIRLDILFEKDIIDKVIKFYSLRRTVSTGTIKLDSPDKSGTQSECFRNAGQIKPV